MRVYSTSDISLGMLHQLGDDLGPDFQVEIDEQQMFYKGGVPSSWVVFFANPDWLIKLLELYAGLYVAEIVKEAGKDTWKNRREIISGAGDRIKQFAVALGRLRSRIGEKAGIQLGLPLPDDHDGTRLELVGDDADELAIQIALFVHYLPALLDIVKQETLVRGRVAAGIHLRILDDGSLEVWWQDGGLLKKETRIIPLRSSDAENE